MSSSAKDLLITALHDLAWSQWTELGVPGYTRRHADVLLDPEALILFTAALSNSDKRLWDESVAWCIQHGSSISISRLKNLLKIGLGSEDSFGEFASEVNQACQLRWPVKNKSQSLAPALSPENGNASAPALDRPALLRLKLRAIFGVGTRADILAELLYTPGKSAAQLARIGYSKRQVANTLDDLTRGGLLRRTREGNTHRFELFRTDILDSIAGTIPSHTAPWIDCFQVLLAVLQLLEVHENKPQNMRALVARRSLEKVSRCIERLRWQAPSSAQAKELWPAISKWALARAKHAAAGVPQST